MDPKSSSSSKEVDAMEAAASGVSNDLSLEKIAAPSVPEFSGDVLPNNKQCTSAGVQRTSSTFQDTINFSINEDVFVCLNDGRFQLGTIVNQHYCVRFGDDSELWVPVDQMRKLGQPEKQCIACKRMEPDDVLESCEYCGRGYHRRCTKEISTGSGIWWCKRCCAPMKVAEVVESNVKTPMKVAEVVESNAKTPMKVAEVVESNAKTPMKVAEVVESNAKTPMKVAEVVESTAKTPMKVAEVVESNAKTPMKVAEVVESYAKTPMKVAEVVESNAKTPMKVAEVVESNAKTPMKVAEVVESNAKMPMKVAEVVESNAKTPMKVAEVVESNAKTPMKVAEVVESNAKTPNESGIERLPQDRVLPRRLRKRKVLQPQEPKKKQASAPNTPTRDSAANQTKKNGQITVEEFEIFAKRTLSNGGV